MIDVCFGDSEAGEIKQNLLYIEKNTTNQDIENFRRVTGEENRVVDLFFSGEKGKYCYSKQVSHLTVLFDIGDISGNNVFEKRVEDLLQCWYFANKQEKVKFRSNLIRKYNRIISAAKKGETIRLWHYDSPHSWCGYYYVLSQIKSYNPTVISLYLPFDDTKSYFNHCCWWLDDFKQNFPQAAKVMTQKEIEEAADKWEQLVSDNKRLRVDSPNGIISVDEDYFDEFILEHIPHGEFKITALIGRVLGCYIISDTFIQQRILNLVKNGTLEITGHYDTKSEYFDPDYNCYLRRIMKEEDRNAILDFETKDNEIIDIFADEVFSLRDYLSIVKRNNEKHENLPISVLKEIAEIKRKKREEWVDKFIGNKYFDGQIVEKMLSFDNKICALDLNLALSDISDDKFYDGRLAYVHNQIVVFMEGEESEAREIVDKRLRLVDKIVNYAKKGYTLRFWCSYNNEDLCALYYMMNLLRGIECPMLLLDLPRRIRKPNGRFIDRLKRWGNFLPSK